MLNKTIKKYKLTPKGRGSSQLLRLLNLETYHVLKNELIQKTLFLENYYNDITISQRLYHAWFDEYIILQCPICNNPLKYTGNFSINKELKGKNYLKTCGKDLCRKEQNYKATKIAIVKKYGVDNISQLEKIKNKKIKTHFENYGTEQPFQSNHFKEKTKETCLKKYGTEHHLQNKNQLLKINTTCLEKYGTSWSLQSKQVRDKGKETCMEKYGVQHYAQYSNKKNGYNWYKYKLPSGKEVNTQGYENMFLREYFSGGGLENNILIDNSDITNKIGKIWYQTSDGKKHRYFPDIYLINENKIVEVKSKYTSGLNLEINQLKMQACLDMKLDFEFKIYK